MVWSVPVVLLAVAAVAIVLTALVLARRPEPPYMESEVSVRRFRFRQSDIGTPKNEQPLPSGHDSAREVPPPPAGTSFTD